jgi:membrane protein DedA with SNARE-associated domain
VLASIANAAQAAGYPALFLLVMAESGGIPLPGETALITAAIVASQGKLQIEFVIAIAALAAIVGDNTGYLISRKVGRKLLERPGLFERRRRRVLEIGEPFFERHGPKAVFIGRWILGLRTWASWLAGASRMPWRSFAVWNAAGGITWATTIGLAAYFIGNTATSAITAFGLFGLLAVVLAAGGALLLRRLHPSTGPARRR